MSGNELLEGHARAPPLLTRDLTFRYWKGPLHYAKTKNKEVFYGDRPETEMIFICDIKNKVMELRNESDQLSLNALTALVCDKNHIDMIVRTLGEDGTIYSPIIGCILQRLVTKEISREEARVLAKKWLPLNTNPYVQKQIEESLVDYGLLYAFEAEDRSINLEDFEIRYKNLREANPKFKKCSVVGCNNPRDITTHGGEDSSCAYHRLLFDAWSYGLDHDKAMYYFENQRARRSAFTKWRNRHGEKVCDEFVLKLAQEAINWAC